MPARIPFTPSKNNYRLVVPIDNTRVIFDNIHWNSFEDDLGWYFDLRQDDETLILAGIKVVLGVNLGRASSHAFFKTHVLRVIDTAGSDVDAGYDDLGDRIQVLVTSSTEVTA